MKSFACGDVVPGCEAKWVCSTDDEILAIVAEHANSSHGVSALSPELVDQVSSRILTSS